MAQTLFTLGFPSTGSPWAYQHTLGVSIKDVETWWKSNLPALKTDLQNAQAGGLGPGNKPLPGQPGYVPPMPVPQPQDNTGTVLLVSVLLVGGGLAGYYYYKQQKGMKGKKASA